MADIEARKKRSVRVRNRLKKVAGDRPRLSVYRSSKNISAQIIDDKKGETLASASSLDTELRKSLKTGSNTQAAAEVGKILAEKAKKAGVINVIFDRGGFIYHGRIKALADAAREAGLKF